MPDHVHDPASPRRSGRRRIRNIRVAVQCIAPAGRRDPHERRRCSSRRSPPLSHDEVVLGDEVLEREADVRERSQRRRRYDHLEPRDPGRLPRRPDRGPRVVRLDEGAEARRTPCAFTSVRDPGHQVGGSPSGAPAPGAVVDAGHGRAPSVGRVAPGRTESGGDQPCGGGPPSGGSRPPSAGACPSASKSCQRSTTMPSSFEPVDGDPAPRHLLAGRRDAHERAFVRAR